MPERHSAGVPYPVSFALLLGILALLFPARLRSQSILTLAPKQCVWHAGDNPAWGAPDLDEPAWNPLSQWVSIATRNPNYWLRCRFKPGRLAAAAQSFGQQDDITVLTVTRTPKLEAFPA